MYVFIAMIAVSVSTMTVLLAKHGKDYETLFTWTTAVFASIAGTLASHKMASGAWNDIPWAGYLLIAVCAGYLVWRWVMFFVDRKKKKAS